MDIEGLAVSKILSVICKSDYLQAYFNRGDKEPSWDGNIYLFNNPGGKVCGEEYKIPHYCPVISQTDSVV